MSYWNLSYNYTRLHYISINTKVSNEVSRKGTSCTSEEWASTRQVLIHLGGWVHDDSKVIYNLFKFIYITLIYLLSLYLNMFSSTAKYLISHYSSFYLILIVCNLTQKFLNIHEFNYIYQFCKYAHQRHHVWYKMMITSSAQGEQGTRRHDRGASRDAKGSELTYCYPPDMRRTC